MKKPGANIQYTLFFGFRWHKHLYQILEVYQILKVAQVNFVSGALVGFSFARGRGSFTIFTFFFGL